MRAISIAEKRATYKKIVCQPGSFKCSCCREFSLSKSKRLNSRKKRRENKRALRLYNQRMFIMDGATHLVSQ